MPQTVLSSSDFSHHRHLWNTGIKQYYSITAVVYVYDVYTYRQALGLTFSTLIQRMSRFL